MSRSDANIPMHKDGRTRKIAAAGALQYTPPELRLQICPECNCPAVLIPGQGACGPCLTKRGEPIRYSFGLHRVTQ